MGGPTPGHERQCRITARKTGKQCRNWAVPGFEVCKYHGAGGEANRELGRRRVEEARAQERAARLIASEGITPVGDPLAQLTQLAGQANAWLKVSERLVNELRELRYKNNTGEQLRAEVALYERALDRTEKFCMGLAKLDLDERAVRLRERQAELIASVFEAVFADPEVGMSDEERERATAVASRHLAALPRAG